MRTRKLLATTTVAIAMLCGVVASAPTPADAAGVTTHGWMAVAAIPKVPDPALRALLEAHEHQVRAGAMFPDAGYAPGRTFGEEAHWQRFVDAYTARILARTDCGDMTDPNGPCADMIAHVMGVAAHGMGDEVWDWLFEPYSPDLGEYYTPADQPAFNNSGAESQMDVVAIGVHEIPRPIIPDLPSTSLLIDAFDDAGLSGVTEQEFALQGLGELLWDVESSWVPLHLANIEAAMPWMSSNLVTAPGGVDFASTAIAGYWETIWGRLLGDQPATRVSITHPAPGQTDLPATGWDRASFQPGTSPGRGGAVTRITAVLTHSLPYRVPGGANVSNQLPAGTMTVTDRSTGEPVAIKSGYPRIVPYTADPGEHLVDVQPAANLDPCRWYDIDLGVAVPMIDATGEPVTPYSWSFRTECGARTVTGSVTDGGDPVEGAWVLAYRPADGYAPTAIGVTGADGNYVIADLPTDASYRLGVLVPGAPNLIAPIASGVEVGDDPVDLDFAMQQKQSIDGRVLDTAGDPADGVTVALLGPGDTWIPSHRTTTAADGTFSFAGLPPTTYQVAYRTGTDPWWFHPGDRDRRGAEPVDVTSAGATLELTLPGTDE